jgi:cytochrome c
MICVTLPHKGDMTMQKLLISIVTLSVIATTAHAQDVAAGQTGFGLCSVCHAVGEGAQNKLGPVLNGLDGRRSGAVAGFDYSPAIKTASIVWSEASFKEFMANPSAKVPGTKMVVTVRDEKDAANLWAYLKQFGPDGKIK